ncbi:MAG: aldehyde dehydrogenase family protein [Sandaracinaceae bacterium]
MLKARGDYIHGAFHAPTGDSFSSHDPATGEVVCEAQGAPERAAQAAAAAKEAARNWAARSFEERLIVMGRFRDALVEREVELAEAIRLEMGKVESESRIEARALVSRFALVESQIRAGLLGSSPARGEQLVYRPHGVVAVLGPFNFPLHLCNAHIVPALMLGNAVVMKPSEVTPLAGQRYAEAADAAGLPKGLFNLVQGGADVGAALVADDNVRALAFTGSYPVGRKITEAALDRPELLLALEMGGKNTCIVRGDADLRQAIHEVAVSGYLTTGQRCTCADRVLVHASVADRFVEGLAEVAKHLSFGMPTDPNSFAGPMATRRASERFRGALEKARGSAELEVIVAGGGRAHAFVDASLHRLAHGVHALPGYLDEELFGPDLAVETFDDDDEVLSALNASSFGFAHALFTRDEAVIDRYRAELETGILNLNRSTNQASPRLPFGGLKKSGNFRPAGAWAGRNLVYPLAEIREVDGVFKHRPAIAAHLPAPDLDRLEAQHLKEETEEAAQTLFDRPRPTRVARPEGGHLPQSEAWHERFYAGGRYLRGEKKPPVVDLLRSHGPFMTSVDDAPLTVLDGMSQTATMPGGFAPDGVVNTYLEGGFGDAVLASADTTLGDDPHALAFAETLRELAPGLPTVSFVNSGAEANEKSYALCHANAPEGADRLLAFEGSFHGRTLLALYASYNPTKRVPFQIAGYEVEFAKTPNAAGPCDPDEPDGWRDVWGAGDIAAARARFLGSDDTLLTAEVEALLDVDRKLEGRFAVVIEPMQSEGGDRYVTPRFHRALRLLTRARGVSLIIDEVQCGFGLGGSFLWHQGFGYVDRTGAPDTPDCVCFAKRAQSGVCLSVFEDPEPTNAFPASLARGRQHALSIGVGKDACRIEGLVRPRLEALYRRWDHRIESPRCRGFALAFDVESTAELMRYLGQRFWRGAVVFGAGTRTVRYRLNASWTEREIDFLFDSMQRTLAWLEAHPDKKPPAWEDFASDAPEAIDTPTVRVAQAAEADALLTKIVALEEAVYEPARRDPADWLKLAFAPGGVAIVAEADGELIGSALGTALEAVGEVPGPAEDTMQGQNNTLYTLAVTVHPDHRGKGLGRALKRAMLAQAKTLTGDDGAPRYRFATGRNRLPDASAMSRLNDSLGAATVSILTGQYGGEGEARYYRQPLGAFVPRSPEPRKGPGVDLASGLARPLSTPPPSLLTLHDAGGLYGAAVSKLTVLNYLTPSIVRATEWVGAITPSFPRTYLCSSRDETVDKSIRVLRWHRPNAHRVVAFEGAYVGHTTAGARSISDPATHRQGKPYFRWPRVPHPADGVEASMEALRAVVCESPDEVLGIYLAPVQERTGRVVPSTFWAELAALRSETGVPVVMVETPSAGYRSGLGAFAGDGIDFAPNQRIWWAGGQLGFVHTDAAYQIDKAFTLVSTWDGDELSLVQAHHQLRAARSIDVASASAALDEALSTVSSRGLGLYRVIQAGDDADRIASGLLADGIRVARFPAGHLGVAPPLDTALEHAAALGASLRRIG